MKTAYSNRLTQQLVLRHHSELELGAEWFHNRLELICSMPHWGNPLRDYPLWDERRLVATVSQMLLERRRVTEGILDLIVDFADFSRAFMDIYHHPDRAIKLGIGFKGEDLA